MVRDRSFIAFGSNDYKHYHRLSDYCKLMSCSRAGVNVDYFALVVRAAGLLAHQYHKSIDDDEEFIDLLVNGSAEAGWPLRRQDLSLYNKVLFTLPVTGVAYGYVVKEDTTTIRDSFTEIFFNINCIIFAILVLTVNSLNGLLNRPNIFNEPNQIDIRGKFGIKQILIILYRMIHSANPVNKLKSTTLPSQMLLTFYIIGVLMFSTNFLSFVASILTSNDMKGYDIVSFTTLLDKMEWGGIKALIWPKFRLSLYCSGDECKRWNRLAPTRTIMAPDTKEPYFDRLQYDNNVVGFASIGDELLRGPIIIYSQKQKELFITDRYLAKQPFSFTISKSRPDIREAFNRAIAWTSPIYPRLMSRYVPPYGIYSKHNPIWSNTPLSLSNFESLWPLFVICLSAIFATFFAEVIGHHIYLRYLKRNR